MIGVSLFYHLSKCHCRQHFLMFVEMLGLAFMAESLPPLVFFAVSFNFVYMPSFLIDAMSMTIVREKLVKRFGRMDPTSIALSAVTVAAVTLGLFAHVVPTLQSRAEEQEFAGVVLKATFVLLSVSTVLNIASVVLVRAQRTGASGAAIEDRMAWGSWADLPMFTSRGLLG